MDLILSNIFSITNAVAAKQSPIPYKWKATWRWLNRSGVWTSCACGNVRKAHLHLLLGIFNTSHNIPFLSCPNCRARSFLGAHIFRFVCLVHKHLHPGPKCLGFCFQHENLCHHCQNVNATTWSHCWSLECEESFSWLCILLLLNIRGPWKCCYVISITTLIYILSYTQRLWIHLDLLLSCWHPCWWCKDYYKRYHSLLSLHESFSEFFLMLLVIAIPIYQSDRCGAQNHLASLSLSRTE